ncbi:hypothetical protein [Mesorhizobium sp. L2C084A000]|uniref:hypothetical protein n=1 Tax=Mesorhizobium sp. L2C084A000 TaxID=1287116 RepID=UPI0009E060A1|nr:hypothetical protein [Mesorhizobium sp. L2C084A000]
MKNTDDARDSGDSRGVNRERTARYVLDIIPESAGPRRATTRRSVIHSARDPVPQTFLTKEPSTGIVLRPIGGLRASLGSDRITEYGAPRVREYLDENVVRKVIAELASFAGVSSNHIIATFGVPPHCGELPIAEVACLAGSSDRSHLPARTPTGAAHASLKN